MISISRIGLTPDAFKLPDQSGRNPLDYVGISGSAKVWIQVHAQARGLLNLKNSLRKYLWTCSENIPISSIKKLNYGSILGCLF